MTFTPASGEPTAVGASGFLRRIFHGSTSSLQKEFVVGAVGEELRHPRLKTLPAVLLRVREGKMLSTPHFRLLASPVASQVGYFSVGQDSWVKMGSLGRLPPITSI